MSTTITATENQRHARSIESSKRVRWDIDKDVVRGRRFDTKHKFLPGRRRLRRPLR